MQRAMSDFRWGKRKIAPLGFFRHEERGEYARAKVRDFT